MTLKTSLIVRKHKAGEPVGYGGTWISEKTLILVIAIGYVMAILVAHLQVLLCGSMVEKCLLLGVFRWI